MNDKAGYSSKPLIEKLGYQPGEAVCLVNATKAFRDFLLKAGIDCTSQLPALWLQGFFKTKAELTRFLRDYQLEKIQKGLWLCWPKKSSGLQTDLTDQTFRDAILPLGWVDVKVAAIDETWSGLKFLRRRS